MLLQTPVTAEASEGCDDKERSQIVQEIFLGETPFPQDQQEVQITLGGNYLKSRKEKTTEASLTAEYGITDTFQVQMQLPYRIRTGRENNGSTRGVGDIKAGLLYAFINKETLVFSGSLDVSIPTGDANKDLGDGRYRVAPSARMGIALGDAWVFSTLGADISKGSTSATYSAALAYPLSPKLVGVVEAVGSSGGEKELYFTPGIVWRPMPRAEIAVGVPLGIAGDAAHWGVVVKVLTEF